MRRLSHITYENEPEEDNTVVEENTVNKENDSGVRPLSVSVLQNAGEDWNSKTQLHLREPLLDSI